MRHAMFFGMVILALLAAPVVTSAVSVRINEIMYDPEGGSEDNEFVEIYFPDGQEKNLTDWVIADNNSNNTLVMLNHSKNNNAYALITEKDFNSSEIRPDSNASIYSAGASIGEGLNNGGDSVYIYNRSNHLMDSVSYNDSLADGNGKSLEFFSPNNSWVESCEAGGSPGEENQLCKGDYNETNTTENTTNTSDTDDKDSEGDQDENNTDQNTGSQSGENRTGECRGVIAAYTDKDTYNTSEKVRLYFSLYNESFPFIIEYWIEDSAGIIVKKKYNTTNTNSKRWTPELEEKDGVFYLRAKLYMDCGNETITAEDENMFIVFNIRANSEGQGAEPESESSILIEKLYLGSDDSIEFGDSLRARVKVYKGDETKSAMDFSVEDDDGDSVSYTTTPVFYDRFTEYEMTIPVQLRPNCDRKHKDGMYNLVAEGIGMRLEEEVRIEGLTGPLCPEDDTEEEKDETDEGERGISYELLDFNDEMPIGEEITNSLLIKNEDAAHSFEVWSYIYRGPKSYSGERQLNKQSITLSAGRSKVLVLHNRVDDAEPGEYRFKVRIRKDSQKTEHEITKDITLAEGRDNENNPGEKTDETSASPELKNALEDTLDQDNSSMGSATGKTVYESSSAKAEKLTPVFLSLSGFLAVLLAVRELPRALRKGKNKPAGNEDKAED
ncbi:MAG: lamin tail domain-containing protein [Candidatus Woesearchaeota archaeon]